MGCGSSRPSASVHPSPSGHIRIRPGAVVTEEPQHAMPVAQPASVQGEHSKSTSGAGPGAKADTQSGAASRAGSTTAGTPGGKKPHSPASAASLLAPPDSAHGGHKLPPITTSVQPSAASVTALGIISTHTSANATGKGAAIQSKGNKQDGTVSPSPGSVQRLAPLPCPTPPGISSSTTSQSTGNIGTTGPGTTRALDSDASSRPPSSPLRPGTPLAGIPSQLLKSSTGSVPAVQDRSSSSTPGSPAAVQSGPTVKHSAIDALLPGGAASNQVPIISTTTTAAGTGTAAGQPPSPQKLLSPRTSRATAPAAGSKSPHLSRMTSEIGEVAALLQAGVLPGVLPQGSTGTPLSSRRSTPNRLSPITTQQQHPMTSPPLSPAYPRLGGGAGGGLGGATAALAGTLAGPHHAVDVHVATAKALLSTPLTTPRGSASGAAGGSSVPGITGTLTSASGRPGAGVQGSSTSKGVGVSAGRAHTGAGDHNHHNHHHHHSQQQQLTLSDERQSVSRPSPHTSAASSFLTVSTVSSARPSDSTGAALPAASASIGVVSSVVQAKVAAGGAVHPSQPPTQSPLQPPQPQAAAAAAAAAPVPKPLVKQVTDLPPEPPAPPLQPQLSQPLPPDTPQEGTGGRHIRFSAQMATSLKPHASSPAAVVTAAAAAAGAGGTVAAPGAGLTSRGPTSPGPAAAAAATVNVSGSKAQQAWGATSTATSTVAGAPAATKPQGQAGDSSGGGGATSRIEALASPFSNSGCIDADDLDNSSLLGDDDLEISHSPLASHTDLGCNSQGVTAAGGKGHHASKPGSSATTAVNVQQQQPKREGKRHQGQSDTEDSGIQGGHTTDDGGASSTGARSRRSSMRSEGALSTRSSADSRAAVTLAGRTMSIVGIKMAAFTGTDLISRAFRNQLTAFRRGPGITLEPTISPVQGRTRPVTRCGVSLAFLLDFNRTLPSADMSTLDVVYKVVVPETLKHRARYVDFIPQEHVSTPTYFVSHRWASPFSQLVTAVAHHFELAAEGGGASESGVGGRNGNSATRRTSGSGVDPHTVFLWIDIFAVNQHPGEAQAGDLAGLQAALTAAKSTLLCLDEAGQVLTRIWCLYEIHHTVRLKGVGGLVVLAQDVQFSELRDIFNSLDASRAQATVEADRRRILEDIQATTGIELLNRAIKEALVESCLLEAASCAGLKATEPAKFAAVQYKAGQMLRVAGRYKEAEKALREMLAVYEAHRGTEDKQTAACMTTLGVIMQEQGRLKEAEAMCREGLALTESLLSAAVARYRAGQEERPLTDVTVADVIVALNNLASVLQAQGKFAEALPLCEKAHSTCRKVRGATHPDTASAAQTVAQLLQAMGRSEDADKLLRQVLHVRETTLGAEHPLTAQSYDALGCSLQQRGRAAEAEPLLVAALEARQHALGPEHPAVAASIHNLASLMQDMGRYAEAEELAVRAVELREAVLGPGHPATASSLNNLAALYKEQGCLDKAVPLLQRALEARTRALGPEHPATSSSLNNLAMLLLEKGHVRDAEPLFVEHLRVLEKVLGPSHADVAMALQNYAACVRAAGNQEQACALYRKALVILETAAGPEHPDTAVCCKNLATLLQESGRLQEAVDMYTRALTILQRLHGEVHASCVPLLHALGALASKRGDHHLAVTRLKRAVHIRRLLDQEGSGNKSLNKSLGGTAPNSPNVGALVARLSLPAPASPYKGAATAPSSPYRSSMGAGLNGSGGQQGGTGGGGGGGNPESELQLASSLNELGGVLQDLGDHAAALECFREALALRTRHLGPRAEATALVLENTGTLLLDMGRAEEAEPLLRQALAATSSSSGTSSGAAALSWYNLGRALEAMGGPRWSEAKEAYSRAVSVGEAALGSSHPDVLQYRQNLASFLEAGPSAATGAAGDVWSTAARAGAISTGPGAGKPVARRRRRASSLLMAGGPVAGGYAGSSVRAAPAAGRPAGGGQRRFGSSEGGGGLSSEGGEDLSVEWD